MANDEKWQLAFWIITVICGVWLLSLTGGVVANERLNVSEHTDLREGINSKLATLVGSLASIDSRLVRIETKLEK